MLVRGWLAAVAVTVPAAVLHGVAHGSTPHPLALGIALALSAAICVPLVGGARVTRPRIAIAVILAQGAYHLFFSGADTLAPAPLGHQHHAPVVWSALPVPAGVASTMTMQLAHVAAAALTIVLLCRAESLARRLCAMGRDLVDALLALAGPVSRPVTGAASPVRSVDRAARTRLGLDVAPARGPPRFAV